MCNPHHEWVLETPGFSSLLCPDLPAEPDLAGPSSSPLVLAEGLWSTGPRRPAGGALLDSAASCVAFVSVLPSYCSTDPGYARPHSHRPRPRERVPRRRAPGLHRLQTGTGFPRPAEQRPRPGGFQPEAVRERAAAGRWNAAARRGCRGRLRGGTQRSAELPWRGEGLGSAAQHQFQAAALQASVIQTAVEITPRPHALRPARLGRGERRLRQGSRRSAGWRIQSCGKKPSISKPVASSFGHADKVLTQQRRGARMFSCLRNLESLRRDFP
ncbi:uncharacterized protein LOC142363666 [Opisthocomus hoazin]|uniref:uncharacterized protein LOC142363666 n=1 Tax=Opisthocomus hoazin TaxID=30419 RepID=UPI003F53CB66